MRSKANLSQFNLPQESVESVMKKKRKAMVEKICRKKVLSLEWKSEGVMDDMSVELMEPM